MSHPATEAVLRHRETLIDHRCLLIQPPDNEVASGLPGSRVFSDDWIVAEQSASPDFGRFPTLGDEQRVIVFCPRERERQEALFAHLASQATGQEIWLVGRLKGGIKPAAKRLAVCFENVHKFDSARHCAIFVATVPRADRPPVDPAPTKSDHEIEGAALTLCSFPGVYGHDKLDVGTALLLNALPEFKGRGLDVGCGDGVITAWLKATQPALEMTAVDCSAHALEATKLTLAENELQATVLAANVYPPKPANISERYDFIICNPPFHRGVGTHYGVINKLITEARDHLVAGGQLWIVANSHLPYQPILDEHLGRVKVIAETPKFKVWRGYRQSAGRK